MIRADRDDHGSWVAVVSASPSSEQVNVMRGLVSGCPDLLIWPVCCGKGLSFRGLHAVARLRLLAWVGQPRPVHDS